MSSTTIGSDEEIARIGEAMAELLAEQEIGALATLDRRGHPSVLAMHFACDGLVAYIHTFTQFRKYQDMLRDGRVSYTVWHEPPAGYAGRREVRGAQVTGHATLVENPDELQTALRVSYAQFPWLRDHDVYAGFRKARDTGVQAFFRVAPIEALWHDGRVAMSYRRLVTFDPDSARITAVTTYPPDEPPQAPRTGTS
jgi:nitroimidazol reductase NimA-like FMN-containing flavoprotein (pyridoxamine 5'-phosphate oxidase superfamily)